MDLNVILAIAVVLLGIVAYFALKNRKNATKMMESNTGVIPLLLQKSTQIKVTRLQEATQNNTQANEQLVKLVTAYKSNLISIQDYNQKLDKMIFKLDIDL